ncbi:uncharacterized protein LOC143076384 [Mytilus galloprovincialis]|uniref:uncharacterized protein LOC143076384 n=1 Tax=Mytilus galloprovincialis TaxID=29158 RepID=UPI003F7B887F
MVLYDLCITKEVWMIVFLFILFRYTDFIQGTSIEILSASCPGSCDNVTIEVCTGRSCDMHATSTCFSHKFEPIIGYKHVFKCSEKFIHLIKGKVYFGNENYTLCENAAKHRPNATCLKRPTCKIENIEQAHNSNNNYSFEVKIGDECTRTNYLPYILTGVGVVALAFATVILFYNRNACTQCVKEIAQKRRRQGNRIDDLDQKNREEDMPAILRERTLINPRGPIQTNIK